MTLQDYWWAFGYGLGAGIALGTVVTSALFWLTRKES